MKRKILLIFAAGIFVVGITLGILLGALPGLEASSPEGEVSRGERTASVVWHEHWQGREAYVSSLTGYQKVGITLQSGSTVAVDSGRIEQDSATGIWQVSVYPDMVVSRWQVHGHIHFR